MSALNNVLDIADYKSREQNYNQESYIENLFREQAKASMQQFEEIIKRLDDYKSIEHTTKKTFISSKIETLLSNIEQYREDINRLLRDNDIESPEMLMSFVKLKIDTKNLYETTKEGLLSEASMMLYDAIRKQEVENLSENQFEAVSEVCNIILNPLTEDDIGKIDDILFEADLDWVMGND